ncbi:AzlD family protein [Desulfohalovibrio reitneri]|uniref:AzlD family protein n=1 Tax=Desulfohalovibrio reitneri TaxID=1307759 RepID=UPI0004A6C0BA|nr:AzlD domain-containing protein [Desulfohalovibrio reitneri]
MSDTAAVYLTIAGMVLATYLTRVLGLFLATRLPLSGRAGAFLQALPGGILIGIVAPAALTQGTAEAVASLITIITARAAGSLPLAMLAGVAAVWALRHVV